MQMQMLKVNSLMLLRSETQNRDELFDIILTGKFEFAPPYWDKISTSAKV